MIVFRDLALATAISVSSALLVPQDANAFELTGAWATGADQCTEVFARKGRAKQGRDQIEALPVLLSRFNFN